MSDKAHPASDTARRAADEIAKLPYVGPETADADDAFVERAEVIIQAAMDEARQEADEQIAHWRTKAECYGGIVHACSPVLEKAGVPVDASTSDGSIGGIRRAVEALAAERDAQASRVRELEAALRVALRDSHECAAPDI